MGNETFYWDGLILKKKGFCFVKMYIHSTLGNDTLSGNKLFPRFCAVIQSKVLLIS